MPWIWSYQSFVPAEEGIREALCTLGNGYLATRGAVPEARADGVHYPGTYAACCYNRLESRGSGQTVVNESIVNLPNWLAFELQIDDGPWFDVTLIDLLAYEQVLDLRRGVLGRRIRFRDGAGRTTALVQRRFVHMELPHIVGLQTRLLAEDWSGTLRIRSGIDGGVENAGVERYRALAGCHLEMVQAGGTGDETILLVARTTESHISIAEAARTRIWRHQQPEQPSRRLIEEGQYIGHELVVDMAPGHEIAIDKVAAIYLSHDRAIAEPVEAALTWLRRAPDFDQLLERHVLAWRHLWDRSRFQMASQTAARITHLHLFHVLETVSWNSVDLDVGVPARGLHGEAYRGHVFWDELFVFPILTLRFPTITRSILLYRYRRLPEARWAAREAGYAGAMYPWQSGSDGREQSPTFHLNPRSGHWVPDPSSRQRHIGIAIAYNIWQYYQATRDREFLSYCGAEMILEIARFWASVATHDPASDRWMIRGVHIRYREHPITLRLGRGGRVVVITEPGRRPPIRVRCRDQEVELEAGQHTAFPL